MDVSLNRCSGSSARYHNGWVLTEWKHNGWIYSGQAIQPALAQFQRQQTMDVVLSPGPKRYSYRLSSGVVALSSALSSALSAWFLGLLQGTLTLNSPNAGGFVLVKPVPRL